jgi:UDP-2,3-diacylglucosamine hydrolase
MPVVRENIYFASDFHLGVPSREASLEREKAVVQWLEYASRDAAEIFLVGDIFDFWFEYKRAVPRGYTRLLGKISEITDSGIPVHVFTGNHDMWIFDYLSSECGVHVYRKPILREWNGKKFYIGHGDGLGPGDHGYKFLKQIFSNPICQWLFARLHPNFGIWVASFFSRYSRSVTGDSDKQFLGVDKEWLVVYCKESEGISHNDFYVFGHRHLPLDIKISDDCRYINLGEWLNFRTFAKWNGSQLELFQWSRSGPVSYKT